MEFLIAIVGVALAVWMIIGARSRHRDRGVDETDDVDGELNPDDTHTTDNIEPPR